MHTVLPEFFLDSEFAGGAASPDDIFSILEALDGVSSEFDPLTTLDETILGLKEAGEQPESTSTKLVSQKSTSSLSAHLEESETELEAANSPQSKRQKRTNTGDEANLDGGQPKISHITVERNRRKQMNENLSVLRSIMPSFYVKRGDQASIVGGVVDYISELQQVLQSLEAKKQRKIYNEVLSPRLVSSPRTLPLSPRKPPLSPRLLPPSLPVSPRTPQTASPYKPHRLHQPGYLSQTMVSGSLEPSSSSSSTSSIDQHSVVNELVANSKSAIADVEVKLCGPNVVLKTISPRMPGQVLKIISALEGLSLEILDVSLNTIDETMLNSFTIKIGIGCKLSAEELAHQIQQTFC